MLALKIDARFSVIEAALIGYGRWRATQKVKRKANGTGQEAPSEQLRTDESIEDEFEIINSNLEKWCLQLQQLRFKVIFMTQVPIIVLIWSRILLSSNVWSL